MKEEGASDWKPAPPLIIDRLLALITAWIFSFSLPEIDHDIIDLHSIDAKKHGGVNDAFKFVGTHHFHHKEGELRFTVDTAHTKAIVQGDVNGDGKADIEIELTGNFSGINALHGFHFNL